MPACADQKVGPYLLARLRPQQPGNGAEVVEVGPVEDAEERLLGSCPLHRLLLRLHRKQLGRGRAQLLLGGGLAAGVCLWRGRQRLGPGMSKNTTPAVTASSGSGAPGVPEPACRTPPGHRATSPCLRTRGTRGPLVARVSVAVSLPCLSEGRGV